MHRFFVPAGQVASSIATIEDKDTISHIKKTLRLKTGDKIELFDGEGTVYKAVLAIVSGSSVTAEITSEDTYLRPERAEVWLGQAATQAGKTTDILRMNTEVGVDGFILFETEYSQGKLKDNKLERFLRIVREAVRQSERIFVPDVQFASGFSDLFNMGFDLVIMLSARDDPAAKDISELKAALTKDQKVLVLIGPEGGFSPAEKQLALDNHVQLVHLQLPVLRTQTAGIVVSSILLY